jgi:hypothetical protein
MALLSEWEHVMPTKPYNFAQMTLIKLLDKSYEGFMLTNVKKMLQCIKNDNLSFIVVLLWPR